MIALRKKRIAVGVTIVAAAALVCALVGWRVFHNSTGSDKSGSSEITTACGKVSADGKADSRDYSKANEESYKNGGYGIIPSVSPDTNEQTKSVAQALQTGEHPERISVYVQPAPFNAESWKSDESYRKQYLGTVEPGRCFQTAQPGKGVPVLAPRSSRFFEILQGETAVLKVQTTAGMPVSFTSMDAGVFTETQLSSATVMADSNGIAEVHFLATPGVINDSRILSGSPACSGQIEFKVNIQLPPEKAALSTAESK